MNALQAVLRSSVVDVVGWTLVHSIWQIALVAVGAAVARSWLRGRSANARYAVGCLAMLLMLALPGITAWLLADSRAALAAESSRPEGDGIVPSASASLGAAPMDPSSDPPQPAPAMGLPASEAAPVAFRPSEGKIRRLAGAVEPLFPAFVAAWFAGVLILSLRLLAGWLGVQRLRHAGIAPAADRWQRILKQLTQRLGIRQKVALFESLLVEVPAVVGHLRPVLLLPASALTGLGPEQIESLLAHELAHIRRHDYLVNLIQKLVETLLFYHPAVWWVSAQVRREREHCCDDLAVAVCGDRATYARALATMEGLRGRWGQPAMAADGGSLVGRLRRIVGRSADTSNRRNAWIVGLFLVVASFACVIAAYAAVDGRQSAGASDPSHPQPSQSEDASEPVAPDGGRPPAGADPELTPENTQWIERLAALRGHKAAAFQVGPELARLEPDFGLQVVEAAWPQLTDFQVKRGLLKAFHFKRHPRVLEVLHLGVTDANTEVRETALHYLFDYSKQKFTGNTEAYQAWFERFGHRPLEEVAVAVRTQARPEVEKKLEEVVAEFKQGHLRRVQQLGAEFGEYGDPIAIPTLIGVIDADNSYQTVYFLGYFALGKMTGVDYSRYHDGAWWRRWWEKNKSRYPEEVRSIPIPDLPKTEAGKAHTPFAEELDTVDGKLKYLLGLFEAGDIRQLSDVAQEIADHEDPRAIPTLIGVIDADNSYDTVYGVGYFGLGRITGVNYSAYHDGAWWRRWWEKNKSRYPEEVQTIPIPDLPKTEAGKAHTPFPEELDTVDGKLEHLLSLFRAGKMQEVHRVAREIAEHADARAIPTLIGVIDADNSHETVYGVGYSGLGRIADVRYSPFHDGAWWRRWWQRNKSRYPDAVRSIPIPEFPKTAHGKRYKPYPEELDTFEGKVRWIEKMLEEGNAELARDLASDIAAEGGRRAIPLLIGAIDADNSYETVYGIGYFHLGKMAGVEYSPFHDGAWWRRWWEKNKANYPQEVQDIPIPAFPKTPHGKAHQPFPENLDTVEGQLAWLVRVFETGGSQTDIWTTAQEIAKWKDPRAIPTMIGLIEAENTYDTIYGLGYFGLGNITGVVYEKDHDGAWWRKWWEENKSQYPEEVRKLEIPDYRELVASWRPKAEANRRREALADVADVPAEDLKVDGNERMRYFLIGAGKDATPPKDGYKLVIVMPGGDGSADFHPFVRRLYKHAMGDEFLVAEPVAFKWHPFQRIVWPTRTNPALAQKFATEDFVEAVIEDVKKRHPIDKRCIFTLTWSSSGPAAYAISLQEKTAVTGSYIAMSVFRREWLPPLDAAKGHVYWLMHSPEDRVCPFDHAQQARQELTEAGATVELDIYQGGHGWHGDVYAGVRRGIAWLIEQRTGSSD